MSKKKMIQFAAVAVLLLLIIVTKFTGNRASFAPVAPWGEEADRIEIHVPGKDPIVAAKKADSWFIGDKEYSADEGKITRMTDALNSLKVGQMVSREGELERYKLEDADAITVAVYHDNDVLRSIRIGKEADKGSGCYITLAGREGIYLVEGALRSIFDVSLDELRNRQIFSFTSSDIISVGVASADARFSLRKSGEEKESWQFSEAQQERVDQKKITDFISQLARINATAFLAPDTIGSEEEASWSLTFQSEKEEHTLRIYGKVEGNDNAYRCLADTNKEPFSISAYKAGQLMKPASWFISEEKPKEEGK
ncbi:DUF4340 domain-containing protein [Sediminispirochaeta bajacaliforniensis]|uniref:DUF4340 domain-containing protein n=1 Tax=Sediminispirochaeta bajacaliforniensis TaxID=148 RepID=UPI0003799EA5|nr:DUF4340 domain-containing protein [Sediminispirochaeta bajacaliforniensis]